MFELQTLRLNAEAIRNRLYQIQAELISEKNIAELDHVQKLQVLYDKYKKIPSTFIERIFFIRPEISTNLESSRTC